MRRVFADAETPGDFVQDLRAVITDGMSPRAATPR